VSEARVSSVAFYGALARASARTDVVTKPITARQARDVRLDGVSWRRHRRHRHPERAREHRAGVDIIVDIVGARVVARIDGVNVPAHILAQRIERARAQHVIERHLHARAALKLVRLRTLARECVGVDANASASTRAMACAPMPRRTLSRAASSTPPTRVDADDEEEEEEEDDDDDDDAPRHHARIVVDRTR